MHELGQKAAARTVPAHDERECAGAYVRLRARQEGGRARARKLHQLDGTAGGAVGGGEATGHIEHDVGNLATFELMTSALGGRRSRQVESYAAIE